MIGGGPDRRMLVGWFLRELCQAQSERSTRQDVTESGELGWAVFERERLLELINQERTLLGKPVIEMASVMQIEQSAVGHFDYTRTLAIGAADQVLMA